MDPLALLCNLHADGPATLQRLRRSGCESLSALLTCEATDLVERLDWVTRRAERFLREAAHLSDRVDGGLLEPDSEAQPSDEHGAVAIVEAARFGREEKLPEPGGGERALPPASSEGFLSTRSEAERADAAQPEVENEDAVIELVDRETDEAWSAADIDGVDEEYEGDDDPSAAGEDGAEDGCEHEVAASVEQVVTAWRALDHSEPPVTATEFVRPLPPQLPGAQVSLARLTIDGLTPSLVERLASHGVETLQSLVEVSTLDVARALSLGYTRVARLQFLARRRLLEGTGPATPARRRLEETVTPAVRGYVTRTPTDRLDTSGPFA